EDGIRDKLVTGVQTCALPIFSFPRSSSVTEVAGATLIVETSMSASAARSSHNIADLSTFLAHGPVGVRRAILDQPAVQQSRISQIGRASCRERVEIAGGGVAR